VPCDARGRGISGVECGGRQCGAVWCNLCSVLQCLLYGSVAEIAVCCVMLEGEVRTCAVYCTVVQ